EAATRERVDLAGQYLFRDLCSGLGRAADLGRAGLSAPPWGSCGQHYQTFGLFQLSCPRRRLLRAAARRLCQRLVQRWMARDSKPTRGAGQEGVKERGAGRGLGGDSFIARLREAAQEKLRRAPESLLRAVVEPLEKRLTASPAPGRRGATVEATPDEAAAA